MPGPMSAPNGNSLIVHSAAAREQSNRTKHFSGKTNVKAGRTMRKAQLDAEHRLRKAMRQAARENEEN